MLLRLVVSRKIYLQAAHNAAVLASCSGSPGKAQRSSGPDNALVRAKNLTRLPPITRGLSLKVQEGGKEKEEGEQTTGPGRRASFASSRALQKPGF